MHWLTLERNDADALMKQLYRQLRHAVLEGRLEPEERLPSSRELARLLGVSRNVVLEVYEQLAAEGYVAPRRGSGTFVAPGARYGLPRNDAPSSGSSSEAGAEADLVDFRTGVPLLREIPWKTVARSFRRVCDRTPSNAWGYGAPEGTPALRESLARFLARSRDISCSPGDLVITNGAAEALCITALLLARQGKTLVVTEDPVHLHFQQTLRLAGTELYPLSVDEAGLRTDELPRNVRPGAVFLTPSHQFPLGGTLSVQRRIDLAAYAAATECLLIEDDYESEFRFEGLPVSSLRELVPSATVYIGSFSKILSPALRLGYAIVPSHLGEDFRRIKYDVSNHTSSMEQRIVADLLDEGVVERHIARMKRFYREGRKRLVRNLADAFPGRHEIRSAGAGAGLHLVVRFPGLVFDAERCSRIEARGVRIHPVEGHAIRKGHYGEWVILGYGNLSFDAMDEGVARLRAALDAEMA